MVFARHCLSRVIKPAKNPMETTVKKLLLAVAFTSAFAAGVSGQTFSPPPRDPPFGKRLGNDSPYESGAGTVGQSYRSSNQSIPRDLPFGKGNPDNDTFNLPNSADGWRGR